MLSISERVLYTTLVALGGLLFTCLVVSVGQLLQDAIRGGALSMRGKPRVVIIGGREPVTEPSLPPKANATVPREEPQAAKAAEYPRDELTEAWAVIDRALREAARQRVGA